MVEKEKERVKSTPERVSDTQAKPEESWEKEFEKLFDENHVDGMEYQFGQKEYLELVSFIRSLFLAERNRIRDSIKESRDRPLNGWSENDKAVYYKCYQDLLFILSDVEDLLDKK